MIIAVKNTDANVEKSTYIYVVYVSIGRNVILKSKIQYK